MLQKHQLNMHQTWLVIRLAIHHETARGVHQFACVIQIVLALCFVKYVYILPVKLEQVTLGKIVVGS